MARNPNAQANLRSFPKGVSGNPAGRPKSLAKMIKDLPPDIQPEIIGVIAHALTLRSIAEAKDYIKRIENGKISVRYGAILELTLKSLSGPHGWFTLKDIMDRLFGKPRVQAEIRMREPRQYIVIGDVDVSDKVQQGDFVIYVDSKEDAEMIMNIGNLDV